MWEINHPFPYEDSFVINKTIELESFLEKESITGVVYFHSQMRDYLNKIDYEYMIWQEWKEGYARYIENLIVKGSLSIINDSKLPKTDSILRIIAARIADITLDDKPRTTIRRNPKTLTESMSVNFRIALWIGACHL